jgi:hypothetical protein
MNSRYNIYGLHLRTAAETPLLSKLLDEELKAFKTNKISASSLRLILKPAPFAPAAPYPAPFEKYQYITNRVMTREFFAQHYRQSLISAVTYFKKKEIHALVSREPSLFPDPACYFCLTQPISPWLKQKGLFFLHAGCVSEKGEGILITGSSGAGKSTLTCAALQSGFKFLSDEQPLLSIEKGKVIARAFPRRIRMDRLPASLFPELRPVLKSSKSKRLVFHAKDIWPGSPAETSCRPKILIFPHFDPKGRFRLNKIQASAALAGLLQDEHLVWYQDGPWKNLSRRHLELLKRLADSTPAYKMSYGVKDILRIPSVFRKLLHG